MVLIIIYMKLATRKEKKTIHEIITANNYLNNRKKVYEMTDNNQFLKMEGT